MGKRFPILLGLLLMVVALGIQISKLGTLQNYIHRLENLAYDIQLRTKTFIQPKTLNSSVAIVDINDVSLAKEGRWPWPRSKLAELFTQINQAGAVVIAFDMIFPEKESVVTEEVLAALKKNNLMQPGLEKILNQLQPHVDNDQIFANALAKGEATVGMSFLQRSEAVNTLKAPVVSLHTSQQKALEFIEAQGYISNIPVIQNAVKTVGFVNVYADSDGIIRKVPLLVRYKNNLYPSLALETVRLFLLTDVKLITEDYGGMLKLEGVSVGGHNIPTDSNAQIIVPFRGPSFTLPYYSASDVLRGKLHKGALDGKIVFIGTSATGLGDLPATAIESVFPGVEIQATIADGILTDNFSYKPAWGQGAEIALTILLGLMATFLYPYLGAWLLVSMVVIIPAALIFLNNWLWEATGLIISIFIPMLLVMAIAILNIVYGYLFETRRREQLKEMFGQYVPEKHIDEMLTHRDVNYGLYGEDREMTVLFADIRNFTGISEQFSATQIKELLNDFFTPMTEIIFKHRGTIDKYVGDLIMAFWGAPLKDRRHAYHAMSAALEMQKKILAMHHLLASHGWPELQIGIGLNSGPMSVGDMGSKFHRNYTVLGDAVNLASRVEALTKYYGVKIIVTEFTAQNQPTFVFRELDRVKVWGREQAVHLYELLGRKKELSEVMKKELELHLLALKAYYNQDWKKALELFTQLRKNKDYQILYSVYLDRINHYIQNPPDSDWDGVYKLTEK